LLSSPHPYLPPRLPAAAAPPHTLTHQLLLTGDGRRAGVLQEVGAFSWKNNRLKNSAVLALTLVARFFDPKQNADAAAFVAVFTCQSVRACGVASCIRCTIFSRLVYIQASHPLTL
jgi:hypothetical protein